MPPRPFLTTADRVGFWVAAVVIVGSYFGFWAVVVWEGIRR